MLGKAVLAKGVLVETAEESLEFGIESGPLPGTRYTSKVMKDI